MQQLINANELFNNIDTLGSISILQNNTNITGGYIYITSIGFYFGNPSLTGLSATSDNSIVVDKNGTRWIFQPQLQLITTNNNPTFGDITATGTITTPILSSQFIGTSSTGEIIAGNNNLSFLGTSSATSSSTTLTYTGLSLAFTPTNSQNYMLNYNIFSGDNSATVALTMVLYIDNNPPPAAGSTPPATAIQIDSGGLTLGGFRTQTLINVNNTIEGGNNSGTANTITLNTKYYFTWYLASTTAGDVASLQIFGFSVQSI